MLQGCYTWDAKAESKMKNCKNSPHLVSQLKLLIYNGIFLEHSIEGKKIVYTTTTLQIVQSLLTFCTGHY